MSCATDSAETATAAANEGSNGSGSSRVRSLMAERAPSLAEIEALAARALGALPRRFKRHLGQLAIRVEDFEPAGHLDRCRERKHGALLSSVRRYHPIRQIE